MGLDWEAERAVASVRARLFRRPQTTERIGRFVVHARIGAGGMGIVYRAHDPELDRTVAVKLLRTDRLGADASAQARLVREARALAAVSHPNVVEVFDVGTHGDDIYVAMELVEGVTLRQYLMSGRTSPPEILALFDQICDGLAALHGAGLVHRDVKPENIMIGRDGRARLLDLGLARRSDTEDAGTSNLRLTLPGTAAGTPKYMAPEQEAGEDVDARADQFSVCVCLREALGDPPRRLKRVLAKGTAHDPNARYESIRALQAALFEAPRRRWILGAAAAVVLVVGAVLLGTDRSPEPVPVSSAEPATVIAIAAVDAELRLAGDAANAGLNAHARDVAERAVAHARMVDDPQLLARALLEAGKRHAFMGEFETGEELLTEAAWTASSVDDHAVASEAGGRLALLVGGHRARPDDAMSWVRFTEAAIERGALGADDKARLAHGLATIYRRLARYDEAEAQYIEARRLYAEAADGEPNTGEAAVLHNHAAVSKARSKLDAADDLLAQSLAMRVAVYGEDHPVIAETWSAIGSTILSRDAPGALAAFRKAQAIYDRCAGDHTLKAAVALINEAAALQQLRDPSGAAEAATRAIPALEKELGADHPNMGTAWTILGRARVGLHQHAEAREAFLHALAVKEAALGSDHPDLATTIWGVAAAAYNLGDYDRAEVHMKRARELALSVDDRGFADLLTSKIGAVHVERGEYPAAIEVIESVLAGLGDDDWSIGESRFDLAKAYWGVGRSADALRSAELAEAAYTRLDAAEQVAEVAKWRADRRNRAGLLRKPGGAGEPAQ